jgi:flavin-dependent dehydrogenase
MNSKYDVIVTGGGPAGSCVSALLAKAGHKVLVIEKEIFPRFHIGESLLPVGLAVFEKLGFDPVERGIYLRKGGAEFYNERNGRSATFMFDRGLEGTPGYAWQVERATFDHDLLKRSIHFGADVHEGERVTDWKLGPDQVVITTDKGEYTGRYFIDATGQDAMTARRNHTVDPIKGFGMGAAFCHFVGINEENQAEFAKTGNIRVLLVEDGWMWMIPLLDRKLSVGLVKNKKGVTPEILEQEIANSPMLQRMTVGCTRTQTRMIRNFSYINRNSFGPRWACIGDAACFLDPVFSSGVSLALLSGETMAEVLSEALKNGEEAAPTLAAGLTEHMYRGYRTFGSIIRAFYDTNIVENLFFYEDPEEDARRGFVSILAGDLWREDNRFQDALIDGRRGWHPGKRTDEDVWFEDPTVKNSEAGSEMILVPRAP